MRQRTSEIVPVFELPKLITTTGEHRAESAHRRQFLSRRELEERTRTARRDPINSTKEQE